MEMMLESITQHGNVLDQIGILAGSVISVLGATKAIFIPTYKGIKRISEIYEKLEEIANQFKRNGGESLKDQMVRIELLISEIRDTQHIGEQKLRAVIQNRQVMYFETDAHGDCVWVNQYYQQVSNRSLEALKGNGWILVIEEDERERVFQEWQNAVDQQRDFDLAFHIVPYKQAMPVKVQCRAIPLKRLDDSIRGWLGIITEA